MGESEEALKGPRGQGDPLRNFELTGPESLRKRRVWMVHLTVGPFRLQSKGGLFVIRRNGIGTCYILPYKDSTYCGDGRWSLR